MKNEVKKKMMINRRKSRHQSHAERISEAKVNRNFADLMVERAVFMPRAHREPC
jgi:hypothetical protein